MGHIFISYAREDGLKHAEKLEKALQKGGFLTWRDPRIKITEDFGVELEEKIETASCVVVCVTTGARRPDSFVRREIGYAQAVNRPLIVTRFEDVIPPLQIINYTWLDFFTNWNTAFKQLTAGLHEGCVGYEQPDSVDDDPFRLYLESVYKQIKHFLDVAIIEQIDLSSKSTIDAVSMPSRSKETFAHLYRPTYMRGGELFIESRSDFKTFVDAFTYYKGRLLLLGEPGAGKTITLMAYARDAITKRLTDPSAPLPLYGIITTWDSQTQPDLATWLGGIYPLLSSADVQRVLEHNSGLLLLDGLDELGHERDEKKIEKGVEGTEKEVKIPYDPRLRFVEMINKSVSNNQILITCRREEYAEIGEKLSLEGAVTLLRLSDDQIAVYLRELPALLEAVRGDDALREMVETPLILSLFAFAYQEAKPEELAQLANFKDSPATLRNEIIGKYVERRYAWEAERLRKTGEMLPYSLDEIKFMLGRAAMYSVWDWFWEDHIFSEFDFSELHGEAPLLVKLALDLNLLAVGEEESLRFVHLRVRDYFALLQTTKDLRDPMVELRLLAVNVLGEIGDERAVEPLIAALRDSDEEVRTSAAEGLIELGDERAVEPLIAALRDSDDGVRRSVAEALKEIADERAVQPLIAALRDPDDGVRSSAAQALIGIADERAVEPLIAALRDPYKEVRSSAAEALRGIGDERAVEPLVAALHDSERVVRTNAAEALIEIRDERAVELLVAALHDPNKHVRSQAAYTLGQLEYKRGVEPLIIALRDAEGYVRYSAAVALGRIRDAQSVEPLIAALHDFDSFVRWKAADSLKRIGTPEALAALAKWEEQQKRGG